MADLTEIIHRLENGHSRKNRGMSGQALLTSLGMSLGLFSLYFIAFCVLRPQLPSIYAPKTYLGPREYRVPKLPTGPFAWVPIILRARLTSVLTLAGLDAYFFLRYLMFLIFLMAGLAVPLTAILLPLHATGGGNSSSVLGLLSIANISATKTDRYAAHLVLCTTTLVVSFVLFRSELRRYHEVRARHMVEFNDPEQSRTLLIKGLYAEYRTDEGLRRYFGSMSEQIQHVWFNRDFRDLQEIIRQRQRVVRQLEMLTTRLIVECQGDVVYPEESVVPAGNLWRRWLNDEQVPRTWMHRLSITTLKNQLSRLNAQIFLLQSQRTLFPASNSCFVEFKSRVACFMAYRSIGHGPHHRISPGAYMTDRVYPEDIMWENLRMATWLEFLVHTIAAMFDYLIIFGWAIPMAIVSMVTQVEYLVQLVPQLEFLTVFPGASRLVNGMLSPLLLSYLTSQVPRLFRLLAIVKGYPTRTLVEMDVQKHLFVFLFVQLFLIVTLATGLPNLVVRMVLNTSEGAITLASSLPKATNFFLSYVVASALTMSGNTLLQVGPLCQNVWDRWRTTTPRQTIEALTRPPALPWGTLFPMATNIGAVAITYSLVSPLILVAAAFGLLIMFFAFKYRILYSYLPRSNADGDFYPRAIFQLFSGLYCGQLSLLGTTLLAQLPVHSVLVVALIFATISAQHHLNREFLDMHARIPLEKDYFESSNGPDSATTFASVDGAQSVANLGSHSVRASRPELAQESLRQIFAPTPTTLQDDNSLAILEPDGDKEARSGAAQFEHPCMLSMRPWIWLPDDVNGIAGDQIDDMRRHFTDVLATRSGAEIDAAGNIKITRLPPDMKQKRL